MKYSFPSAMKQTIEPTQSRPVVGWRFHPTHEELVSNYLKPKMLGHDHEDLVIGEINFCKFEPWDLPRQSKIKSNDSVWYFFCPRDFKYNKSRLSNRSTKVGYWKPTGKRIPVKAKGTNKQIGVKKTLVFHKGRPKGLRTGWIMNEYEWFCESNLAIKGDFTLCKLKKKPEAKTCKAKVHDHGMAESSDFESELIDHQNRNTNETPTNSTCGASELSDPETFDVDHQTSSALTTNSACDETRPNHLVNFDSGDQSPTEMVVTSPYNEGVSSRHAFADMENPNSNVLPTYSNWPMDSGFENWISLSDIEAGIPFEFNIGSPYDKVVTGSERSYNFGDHDQDKNLDDFGNQNQDTNFDDFGDHDQDTKFDDFGDQNQDTNFDDFGDQNQDNDFDDIMKQNQDSNFNISTRKEGDRSWVQATPSSKEKVMSIHDKNYLKHLVSLLENDEADDWLSKVSSELVAELGAELELFIEPECSSDNVNQASKGASSTMAMLPCTL